jgi:hypothetical protein
MHLSLLFIYVVIISFYLVVIRLLIFAVLFIHLFNYSFIHFRYRMFIEIINCYIYIYVYIYMQPGSSRTGGMPDRSLTADDMEGFEDDVEDV